MSFSVEPKTDQRFAPWTPVSVAGAQYLRLPLRTRWLSDSDDLVLALKEYLELARPGDTVGVSEKVVILLTGHTVDVDTVRPGRLAHRSRAGGAPPGRWTSPPCSLAGWHGFWLATSARAANMRVGFRSRRRWSTSSVPSAQCESSRRQLGGP